MEKFIEVLKLNEVKYENHTYEITDDLGKGRRYQIEITLKNGIFHEVSFPFSGRYTRDQWRILSFIESEITKLEKRHAKKPRKPRLPKSPDSIPPIPKS